MPRLMKLMLNQPTSSGMITKMFGLSCAIVTATLAKSIKAVAMARIMNLADAVKYAVI